MKPAGQFIIECALQTAFSILSDTLASALPCATAAGCIPAALYAAGRMKRWSWSLILKSTLSCYPAASCTWHLSNIRLSHTWHSIPAKYWLTAPLCRMSGALIRTAATKSCGQYGKHPPQARKKSGRAAVYFYRNRRRLPHDRKRDYRLNALRSLDCTYRSIMQSARCS